jgi:hypothetical protein
MLRRIRQFKAERLIFTRKYYVLERKSCKTGEYSTSIKVVQQKSFVKLFSRTFLFPVNVDE